MDQARPRATVVFLTKNGGEMFRRAIEAVRGQRAGFPFEILVLDSGSTDGTAKWARTSGARVVTIPPSTFNYGGTKNLAALEARGEIVVFLSQDNIPTKDTWLKSLVVPFEGGAMVVQGPAVSEPTGYYWWRHGGFFYTRETRRWLKEFGLGLSCCNLAIRKEILKRVPFRSVPMNEDKVFQRDLRAAGIEATEAPEAPVLHTHTYGPRDLALRLQNEGLGWRYAGAQYSLRDVVADALSPRMWLRAWSGLLHGDIRRPHEFLFPALRPLMVYKGLHFTATYRWERELT